MVTWVTRVRGLRGSVGLWVHGLRGSIFYVGCVDYVGQNTFYVGHNFYLGCVGRIYFCVGQIFFRGSNFFCVDLCMGQNFLRGSQIFVLVNFYLLDEIVLLYYN